MGPLGPGSSLPLHTDRHAQLRQQEPWATLGQRFDDAAVHTCMGRLAQTYNRAQELRTRSHGDDQQFVSLVRNLCDRQYRVPPFGNSHPSVLSFVQNKFFPYVGGQQEENQCILTEVCPPPCSLEHMAQEGDGCSAY